VFLNNDNPIVLVVEDHDDTREMLTILLTMYGCQVIEAENGEAALRLAAQTRPDLILLDMRIPLLDGLAVTRLIRQQPTLEDVPIVAVTGNALERDQIEARSAGCDYYLVKPFDFDRLEQLVKVVNARAGRAPNFQVKKPLAL
jgi:DNA-binding response OmpR family regulator